MIDFCGEYWGIFIIEMYVFELNFCLYFKY